MLTEFKGRKYSTSRASDLKRDGVGLELQQDGQVVAEVFYCDASGEFTISTFADGLPLSIVEQLISEARITLVPVQKTEMNTLSLAFNNEESLLELRFTPDEGRVLSAVAHIRQRALNLTFSFSCFGYDLEQFAAELERLHIQYKGTASFSDQAGKVELECSIVHPARGIVAVTATLGQWVAWPAEWPAVRQQAEKRTLVFQGFTIEQSYLPIAISQIRQFLSKNGVSTIHPMIKEPSA